MHEGAQITPSEPHIFGANLFGATYSITAIPVLIKNQYYIYAYATQFPSIEKNKGCSRNKTIGITCLPAFI